MAEGKTEEFANKGKHWATAADAELPIKIGNSYPANLEPRTVMQVFESTVKRHGDKTAVAVKRDGAWKKWTWQQYYNDVRRAAKAMIALGLEQNYSVNIIGFNSPEWFIADLAAVACGGIAAGIYTTNLPEACFYISDHSEAQLIFVENEAQAKKFISIRARLPKVKAIIQWSGKASKEDGILSWDEFMSKGDGEEAPLEKRIQELKPGKCCTLIYTSGTTGPPKAVMMSHDNLTWTGLDVVNSLKLTENDISISYLPLSHIAAQMLDIYGPMLSGAQMWFAQPDALKGSLVNTLKEVRPTYFLGVPRVWEKMMEKMQEIGKSVTGLMRSVADWAKTIGFEGAYAEQNKQDKPWGWTIANLLVLDKVKQNLGFDRVRFYGTSAAPIGKDTLDYFMSLNIPLLEIYGMSECSGPATFNIPGKHRTGSCGNPMPGCEVKLAEGNQEICMRGRNVFMGYMKNDKATDECIDSEGWLHSGDVGSFDKDHFLTITGRIKELIITAGGENIPPVMIEDEIKKFIGDLVANIMVVGDRKKFLSALVTLKAEPIKDPQPGEYPFLQNLSKGALELAEKLGSTAKTVDDAAKDEKIRKYIEDGIKKYNKTATSNAQSVQKFHICSSDFTLEGGELTPTLKLKRKEVVKKYETDIDTMYKEAEA